jgi:hypothetical protein
MADEENGTEKAIGDYASACEALLEAASLYLSAYGSYRLRDGRDPEELKRLMMDKVRRGLNG